MLAITLFVWVVAFPNLPPILVDRFETEKQCAAAAAELDKSTPVVLRLLCSPSV